MSVKVSVCYQFQACVFKATKRSKEKVGIARVRHGFDCHDVDWIVDTEGNKQETIWDYRLTSGPLCYLEIKKQLQHKPVKPVRKLK